MSARVAWQCPSNLALVKYWGKHGNQLPSNPSLSFTLNTSHTRTSIRWEEAPAFGFTFALDGQPKPEFHDKLEQFFRKIADRLPWLSGLRLHIDSSNSFPHSSGIASSASAFGALGLCLAEMNALLAGFAADEDSLLREAAILARLGSGSATRSLYGGYVAWGQHPDFPEMSDLYGTPWAGSIHPDLMTLQDTILLVDPGQKSVSSTAGHALMVNHPFAQQRFEVARKNINVLSGILKSGAWMDLILLAEAEALMLHGLMMSSNPGYLLVRPDTVAILEKVRKFRQETGLAVGFSLDAGANVHLLYPGSVNTTVLAFVEAELKGHCRNGAYLCDTLGLGPVRY